MPRVIKRYGNRKMYDVEASAYVSLDDVAELIRAAVTVEVVDNVTGEDITAQTLTQIVLEQGKRGQGFLPAELLHDLLRRGGRVIDSGVGQLRQSVDGLVQGSLGRLARVVQVPQADELRRLREQVSHVEAALARLLEEQEAARKETEPPEPPPEPRGRRPSPKGKPKTRTPRPRR